MTVTVAVTVAVTVTVAATVTVTVTVAVAVAGLTSRPFMTREEIAAGPDGVKGRCAAASARRKPLTPPAPPADEAAT